MEAEYGTTVGIRWPNPQSVFMYDGAGNVITCKCGKPAGMGVIGKEAMIAWCADCCPMPNHEAKFVYKPPET
jgi:hypothetical protein